jgi:hypothetical protein
MTTAARPPDRSGDLAGDVMPCSPNPTSCDGCCSAQITQVCACHGRRRHAQSAAPNGANGAELSGVACSSLLACVAAGGYDSLNNQGLTLAEGWNGKTWTIKATPNPSGATGSNLTGVSCRAANACMAVGGSGGNGLFAEAWNGTAWTIKAVPSPQGATFTFLNGVSCGAKAACVAVGDEFNSSQAEVPVAEAWNGTAWTIKPVPF